MMVLLVCLLVLTQLTGLSAPNKVFKDGVDKRKLHRAKRIHFKQYSGCVPGRPLYLTPYIRAGKVEEAQSLARVSPDIGGMPSYSGFLTVNDHCGSHLFFWYFPAQLQGENAPLVTWLQGGPGSSGMFGVFMEVGPFSHSNGRLKRRKYSWNIRNNLLFFDQPVGTGFSHTTGGCYARNETMVGIDMYNALVQFLTLFPNLQQNKFVLTGESYAGHYIPAIAYAIHNNNPLGTIKINLYGMMIGAGWSDPREQIGYAEYVYQMGIIEDVEKREMETLQKEFVDDVNEGRLHEAYATLVALLEIPKKSGVNVYNILPSPKDFSEWISFVLRPSTRKAIHVGNMDFLSSSSVVYRHLKTDIVNSVKPLVEELLEHYPIVFFAGQFDVVCGYPMMVKFLRSLQWSGQPQYLAAPRHKWLEAGDLAGFVKGHVHLYDVMVRAAGHAVPADQPFWTYQLLNAFTKGNISSLIIK